MRGLAAVAVVVAYGRFLTWVLTFLLIAWAAFMVVKAMNRLRRKEQGVAEDSPTNRRMAVLFAA